MHLHASLLDSSMHIVTEKFPSQKNFIEPWIINHTDLLLPGCCKISLHWPIIYTLFNLVKFSRDNISLTYHQVSMGFCTSSPQQGVKYQLWYLDLGGGNLWISHKKLPKGCKVLSHLGFKSKVSFINFVVCLVSGNHGFKT